MSCPSDNDSMMKHKLYLIPASFLVVSIALTGCTNPTEPTPVPSNSVSTPDDSSTGAPTTPAPESTDEAVDPSELSGANSDYITTGEAWGVYASVGAKKNSEDPTERSTTPEEYLQFGDIDDIQRVFGEVFSDAEETAMNISKLPNIAEITSVDQVPSSVILNRYPNLMSTRILMDTAGTIYVISESKDQDKTLVASVRVLKPGEKPADPVQVGE